MKNTKLSQVTCLGSSIALSLTLAACGSSGPGSSSSSQSQNSSIPSSVSSTSSSSSSVNYQAPSDDIAVNGDVESGTTNWSGRGDAQITRDTSQSHTGSASLLVTGRADYWHGASFSVGDLTPGNDYGVAVWVKLAEGEPAETVKITGKLVDDADPDTYLEYTEVASATVTSDSWTLLSGNYVPESAFETFIVETFDGSENVSFYLDNFSVAGDVDAGNVGSSSSASSSGPIGNGDGSVPLNPNRRGLSALTDIPIGVAVNLEGGSRDTFNSSERTNIVLNNFSQVSVENNMKMSYWGSAPNYYNNALDTRLISWARDNAYTIHGHTLVWHPCYQLPSWAGSSNGYNQSLASHVQGVASQYTDVIRSWDVVNEVLFDSNDESSYGECRYEQGGEVVNGVNYRKSAHYLGAGGPSYIANAFIEADKVTDADLYYNDFNIENGQDKTTWLVNMVQGLLDDNVPIDGVGFQMHVLPDWPSVPTIRASWQKIVDLGLKVKITELDIRINNQYDGDTSNDVSSCGPGCPGRDNQKSRYKDIIKAYYEVVPPALRGGITIWGISDPDSWYASDPDWPLLWDDTLSEKPAYDGVEEALRESN